MNYRYRWQAYCLNYMVGAIHELPYRFICKIGYHNNVLMKYDSDIHPRKSIRLKDYDYSLNRAYFITICTYEKNISLAMWKMNVCR